MLFGLLSAVTLRSKGQRSLGHVRLRCILLRELHSVSAIVATHLCGDTVFAVVEPMTSSARLKLNMKPEQSGYIMPKILLDVVFEEIFVALAKNQV